MSDENKPNIDTVGSPVWNKPGHGVLADIAETVVKADKDAWKKIKAIIDADPRARGSFAQLARFPDDVRDWPEFKDRSSWHFVNVVWNEGDDPDPNAPMPAPPHAASKIPELVAGILESADPQERADNLAYVLHLVGDLHQPLHCVARCNDQYHPPHGDQGGNLFLLKGKPAKLHSLWDGLLVTGDDTSESQLRKIAKSISDEYGEDSFEKAELEESDPEQWAREGAVIAAEQVYAGIEERTAPSPEYLENALAVAKQRAALGGYRLARLLVDLASKL